MGTKANVRQEEKLKNDILKFIRIVKIQYVLGRYNT